MFSKYLKRKCIARCRKVTLQNTSKWLLLWSVFAKFVETGLYTAIKLLLIIQLPKYLAIQSVHCIVLMGANSFAKISNIQGKFCQCTYKLIFNFYCIIFICYIRIIDYIANRNKVFTPMCTYTPKSILTRLKVHDKVCQEKFSKICVLAWKDS